MKNNINDLGELFEIIHNLNKTSRFPLTKNFIQHGNISVYEHSIFVAYLSYKISKKLNLKVDTKSLIRGALLHDYFLYDWHIKDNRKGLHGFTHPKTALKNAMDDFNLTEKEKDIISHHMFPLTIFPPCSKEAFLICICDKICAVRETFGFDLEKNLSEII